MNNQKKNENNPLFRNIYRADLLLNKLKYLDKSLAI